MTPPVDLKGNRQTYRLDGDPDAPLLQVLRNDLGLKAAKFGCGLEQCGAAKYPSTARPCPPAPKYAKP